MCNMQDVSSLVAIEVDKEENGAPWSDQANYKHSKTCDRLASSEAARLANVDPRFTLQLHLLKS